MTGTLAAVLGLALVDSINPSALVMTLYLLTRAAPPSRVVAYIAGIFGTYLAAGVLLMLGLDTLLESFRDAFESPAVYAVQGVLGAGMLVYSLVPRSRPAARPRRRFGNAFGNASTTALTATVALGMTVTLLELPTAFPYLGAVALLANAGLPVAQWLPVLVVYNVIFVLPPVALLVGHLLAGRRLGPRYERLRERLQHGARETMLWILGVVGFLLLADSLRFLGFLRWIDVPEP